MDFPIDHRVDRVGLSLVNFVNMGAGNTGIKQCPAGAVGGEQGEARVDKLLTQFW